MTARATRCPTASTASPQQLDAVQIRPGRLPRPLFPERKPRRRQGGKLAAGTKRAVQPHHAPLCAKERCADRKMEPAASDKGSRAHAVAGAITVAVARPVAALAARPCVSTLARQKPSGRLLTFGTHPPHRHARESGHPGRRARCLLAWAPAFAGATRNRQPEPSVG